MIKHICTFIFVSFLFRPAFSQWSYLPNAPEADAAERFDDIWFITDSLGWAVNGDGKIYKTADAGYSWDLQFDDPNIYFRSVEFLNADVGFAGTLSEAFYETTDGGIHWNRIDDQFPVNVPGICGMGHWGNMIVGVGIWSNPAYVMISPDAGETWTYQDLSKYAAALIDVKMFGPDTIFISGQSDDATFNHGIILLSIDGGSTWKQVGMGTAPNTYAWKISFPSKKTGYVSLEEFTGISSHILKTTDGGQTWQQFFVTNTNIDMEGIGFINDDKGWLGGWTDGMYATTDGGQTWTFHDFGKNFNRFFFLNDSFGYAAGKSIYLYERGIPTLVTDPYPDLAMHSLNVYPNPVVNDATFQLHLFRKTMVMLDIYNEEGKEVKSLAHQEMNAGDYSFHLKIADASSGMYYAVLRTNEHFLTKKFMVDLNGNR